MRNHSTVALAFFLVTFLVNGQSYAADLSTTVEPELQQESGAEIQQVQPAGEWVPPGFESLNEPQVTEIDLYYGDEFLTSVFARFTQSELSFLNTDAITQLLRNISDPESVNLILQKPFKTNAHALCHSDFQVDCGRLSPETVDIIFDRATLRADLFINPELLLAGQPLQNRFLPDSSAEFSLFTDNAVLFSGVDGEQTTYNFVNTTRIALAESRLTLRSNVTDTQGVSVDTLAWQKEYQGKDYQVGLFRGNASNFRFMGSEQFIGASMASSILTRIDLDQSLGTEIELFFGSRSRIEILRDERLLASGYYDVGNQIIDTSMLPPGSYEIEIRITDSSGVMSTEHRFFSKTSKLPPEDQSIYFLQAGKLTDQGITGGIPEEGISVVRGGFSKRLSPSLGADLGFSATPDSTVYEAGLYKMGKNYEIKAEVAMEDNGAMGTDLNVRWDLDFIRLNLNSRKVWEGDSQMQLGDGYTQSSVSIDVPSRWGSFGLFARDNKRDFGINSSNYGLRWQANSFSIGEGNLSAGLELSRNDDDTLAIFSLSYRLNGQRSQHSFSPGMSYEHFAADNRRQTRLQGSHLSTWSYGDNDERRLTMRADRDDQTSFEARYEDSHRIGDSDVRARYNAGSGQLEYSGQLSSSFAYTPLATGFGGRPRGDSAFIVRVDGVPEESEFEVMINGSARGKTVAGKKLLVPVSPYETYKVELNPLGDSIIDLDDKTYLKTVYPGNVVVLKWSARIIKIIIGRIVDESGSPIDGALIRNVKGFGVTDDRGFFQAEVEQDAKSLIIQKGIDVCEAKFELDDLSKKVFSLGTLQCHEIEDPIVQFLMAPDGSEQIALDSDDAIPAEGAEQAKIRVPQHTEVVTNPLHAANAEPEIADREDTRQVAVTDITIDAPDSSHSAVTVAQPASVPEVRPAGGSRDSEISEWVRQLNLASDRLVSQYTFERYISDLGDIVQVSSKFMPGVRTGSAAQNETSAPAVPASAAVPQAIVTVISSRPAPRAVVARPRWQQLWVRGVSYLDQLTQAVTEYSKNEYYYFKNNVLALNSTVGHYSARLDNTRSAHGTLPVLAQVTQCTISDTGPCPQESEVFINKISVLSRIPQCLGEPVLSPAWHNLEFRQGAPPALPTDAMATDFQQLYAVSRFHANTLRSAPVRHFSHDRGGTDRAISRTDLWQHWKSHPPERADPLQNLVYRQG